MHHACAACTIRVTRTILLRTHACMHHACTVHACARRPSASRTYLCDPTTVVSQRDCSSSGTLAVGRVWTIRCGTDEANIVLTSPTRSSAVHACMHDACASRTVLACRHLACACMHARVPFCPAGANKVHTRPILSLDRHSAYASQTFPAPFLARMCACTWHALAYAHTIPWYQSALHVPNTPRARRSTASA